MAIKREAEIRTVKVWVTTDRLVFLKNDNSTLSPNFWTAYFNFQDSDYWGEQVKDDNGNIQIFASEELARSGGIEAADKFLKSVKL